MPKVFISYSWDSTQHQDYIYQLSNRLRSDGIDCDIDQYYPAPEQGWPLWMEQQIREACFVLVVCTENYLKRFEGREEPGKGQGVKWESLLTSSHIYDDDSRNKKFIPVIVTATDHQFIPRPLKPFTFHNMSQTGGYESLYRYLTDQPSRPKPELGERITFPPDKLAALPSKKRIWQDTLPKIQISKLPHTNSQLFGREDELAMLDAAWENSKTNLITIKAFGGTGKTALMKSWMDKLALDDFRAANAVYTWSFYSQGSAEDKQASADEFFDAALRWFDYQGEPITSAHEIRLATGSADQSTTQFNLAGWVGAVAIPNRWRNGWRVARSGFKNFIPAACSAESGFAGNFFASGCD